MPNKALMLDIFRLEPTISNFDFLLFNIPKLLNIFNQSASLLFLVVTIPPSPVVIDFLG